MTQNGPSDLPPEAPVEVDQPHAPGQPTEAAHEPARRLSWFERRRERKRLAAEARAARKAQIRAERRRRSSRSKHPVIVAGNAIFTLLLVFAAAGGLAAYYGVKEFNEPGPLAEESAIIIPRGSGARDVASRLENAGMIDRPMVFVAGIQATNNRGRLQAGEYLIPARASMNQIMDLLVSGRVMEHAVTIAEGLTTQQILARLRDMEVLAGDVREVPAEGSLLPETYNVTRGTTRAQLVERMKAAHDRVLAEVWQKRDPDVPVKTPEELVTLASIVEKETGVAAERPRVASVFVNRLRKKMRLQSDPTIIYGLVGGQGTLGRPILRSEIQKPTPYNTYTIQGLPPGPIANPGRASLEAVARPDETDDLYFVADGSGGHAFATTYAEHRKNVARWRAMEASAGEADRAPTDAVSAE